MDKNYTVLHLHSDLSNGVTNIDSVTKYNEYIEYANSLGMKAMAFSEHGSVFQWVKKKNLIESFGMKYIHAEEFYVTESFDIKNRDNYHCLLIAKNYDGVKELNRLSSMAFNRATIKCIHDGVERYYYSPRVSFDELINTSSNIIITTACLGGILNKGNDIIKDRFIQFLKTNKERCFLEIQHHNVPSQIEYNKYLHQLSIIHGLQMVACTDTHCLNNEHVRGRKILQKAKNIFFGDEEGWDLTFKSYSELVECYEKQGSLPKEVYMQAIENTNVIASMVEEFSLDYSYKYPKLWNDSYGTFIKKIKEGMKKRKVNSFPNKKEYHDRIKHELKAYIHNQSIDFMLLMADIVDWCNLNDIQIGYGRGSVNGSVIAWLLGITEMDSIKHNLNFERFMNTERVSLSDIDTDFPPSRRNDVKQYIINKKGLYCSDIITFNTIALKGAIRDVGRALDIQLDEISKICENIETNEAELRNKYPEIFEYVDIVNGTIVSVGSHPCGMVVSAHSLEDNIGIFTTSTSDYPVSQINMKEIDSLNYVKLDLLALDTIELINETCKLIGIERYTPDNIDINDVDVWNSMRDDTTQIFQWEGKTGDEYIKRLLSDENIAKFQTFNENVDRLTLLSIGNSAIRPAGASYRDDLASGIVRESGSKAIDDFLRPTFGYLVFQEQIIEFLYKYCGFTMGEADIVRRHFAKKTGTDKDIPIIKNGGYMTEEKTHYIKGFKQTMKELYDMPEEESEVTIATFLQVIIDASYYLFSLNHSSPYTFEGFVSAYLRYHYPLEFLTTALNINASKEEKTTAITNYVKKVNIQIRPVKFRYSNANYSCDRSTNSIYKGMSSIKFMNANVSNALYELRDVKFNSFLDFLLVNPCNSKQTEILIKLNYFSEFGKSKSLLEKFNIYQKYYGKKQFKKDKLEISEDILQKYCSETDKMYKVVDQNGLFDELFSSVKEKSLPLKDIVSSELEYLGYIDYTSEKLKGYGYVCDIDAKYTPKIKIYLLDSGDTIVYKVAKRTFTEHELVVGDIIKIGTLSERHKKRKIDNNWVELDDFETYMNTYNVVKR